MKTQQISKHTNKIAIKLLREEYSDYPKNNWHYDREYNMIVMAIELAADQFTTKEEDKWIDVNKQLPDDLEDVLTVHIGGDADFEEPSGVTMGYYDKENEIFRETNGTFDGELLITHWQPLPSPPSLKQTDNKE